MLTDSHCHLDHLDLSKTSYQSLDELIAAANARGVERLLSVAVDLETSENLLQLAEKYSQVMVSVGMHPLQKGQPDLPEKDALLKLGKNPQVVAIGETGLDNYYAKDQFEWQRESFIRHLQVAGQLAKPVIVHSRDARQETLAILEQHADSQAGGVLHCFTETWEMAEALLAMGFYLSFSGIITFKTAGELREVVKKTPLDRLLIETDSPWLAPMPHRGKQNEPKFVYEVAQCVATIKGISMDDVARATNDNFDRLFLSQR